eukprot:GEMP01000574.1.p1 GENE.GEMP01000574.1~~GEMP01000574.1.p1  ORF type:complete len:2034 (+),score=422.95 GEMP01000574.1:68-6169(+)
MDYYDALGVEANASLHDIRKAYRAKAKISHPDRCGDVGLEQMKEINEAYFVLSHAARRKEYDVARDDCELDIAIDAPQLRTTAGRAQSEKFREKFLHWSLTTPSGNVLGANSVFGASLSEHLQPFEQQKAAQSVLATTFLETVLSNLRHLVLNEHKGKSNPKFYDKLWITIKPMAIPTTSWKTRYACADDDLSGQANMMELVLQNIDDGFVEMALNALESITIDRWDLFEIIQTCLRQQHGVRFALELCQRCARMCDRRSFHLLLEIQDSDIQREVYKTMILLGLKPDKRTAELCRMARVAVELSEEVFQADIASGQMVPLFPISPLCDIDVLRRFTSYFLDVPDNLCAKEIWVFLKPYIPWTRVLERSTKMSLGKTTCAACNVAFRGAPRRRCGACREMCCVKCATLCTVNEMPHWGILREVEACCKCDRDAKKRRREGWSQLARSCECPRAKLRMAFLAEDDELLLEMSHQGHEADALRLLACAQSTDHSLAERLLEKIPAVTTLVPKETMLTGPGLATKLLDAFSQNEHDTCVDLCERLDPEAARVISSRRPDTSQSGEESMALWRMIRGSALCVLGYAFGLIEVQRAAWSGYYGHNFRELGVGMRFHRLNPGFEPNEAAESKANSEPEPAPTACTASKEASQECSLVAPKAVLSPLKLPVERSRPATIFSTLKTPRVAAHSATPRAAGERSVGKGGPPVRLPEKFVRPAFFVPGARAKIPTANTSKSNSATTRRSTAPVTHMSNDRRPSSADAASCISFNSRIPKTQVSSVIPKPTGKLHVVPPPIPLRSAKAPSVGSNLRPLAKEPPQLKRDGTGCVSRNQSHEPGGSRTPTAGGFRNSMAPSRKLSLESNLRTGKTSAPSTPQLKTRAARVSVSVLPRGGTTTLRIPPLDFAAAPKSRAVAPKATSVSRSANSRTPSIDCRVQLGKNPPDSKRVPLPSASVKIQNNIVAPVLRARSVSGSVTPRVATWNGPQGTRTRGGPPPALPVKRPAQYSAGSADSLGARHVRRDSLDLMGRRNAAPPPRTSGSRLTKHLGTQSTTAGTRSMSRSSSLSSLCSSFSGNTPQTPLSLSRSSSQNALPSSEGDSNSFVRRRKEPHQPQQQKPLHPQVPLRQQQLKHLPLRPTRSTSAAPPPKSMKSCVRTQFSANTTTSRPTAQNTSTTAHSRNVAPLSARSTMSARNPPLSARSTTSTRNPPLSARSNAAGQPPLSARSRAATPSGGRPCAAIVKTAAPQTVPSHGWLCEEVRIGSVVRLANLTQQFEYNDVVGVVIEVGERYTVHVGADVSVKVKVSNLETMDGLKVWKKDAMIPPKMVDGSLVRRWPSLSVPGMESKALTRYETQIHKNFEHARDIGLAYVDCAQFAEDIGAAPVTVAWLRSAQWFALEVPLSKDAVCTSLRHALAVASSDFGLLSLVCRIGLGILARLGSESDEAADSAAEPPLAVMLADKYRIVCMMEAFNGPFNFTLSESSIYQIMSRRMNASYLLGLQVYPGIVPQDILWSSLWDYHFLGVCELANGEAARIAAMHAFLESHHYSLSKIHNVLHSPWIGRCDDGWLQFAHGLPPMPIKTLYGVSVSKGSQTISLVYGRPSSNKSDNDGGFLSWRDVGNLFAMQAESLPLYFSLDPLSFPYRRCPLYGCDALPQSYAHTDAMQSIAHADWLLKQLAVGAEVNSQSPFATRPLSFEENWLRPLPKRGSKLLGPHRFWLACESIEYEVAENDDSTTMHFGKVKFQLRSHLKTLEDDEDIGRDHVMEAFCQDLSNNWDKLKIKFPIFRRLEEIAKLQFVAKFLSNYQGTFDASRATEVAARIKATRPPGTGDKIASRIAAHFADQRERISRELVRLKNFSKRFQQKSDNDTLRYMPGVFQMEPRCYGGVLMYPKLKRCNFTVPPNVEVRRLNECLFASSNCSNDSRQKSEPSRKVLKDASAFPASKLVVPVDGEHSVNLPKGPHFQGHLKVKEAMQVAKILQVPIAEPDASSNQEDMCGLFLEATLRTKYLGASRREAADYVATRCERGVRNVPSPPRGGGRS